ncbi:NUDIX domain-containing protein [Wolbachia endosymbiont of Drosophila mauritiana]|uniref:NUDIX hydrolase n=1 Tax=unclassified Wolbachia TaxID=2640676 RepID=UPI00107E8F06|nr:MULTISPECIES: NUDIX domain-containing protein [unclassified Wolbachia]QCB62668.1 NUDIX domain-containing protein [Wolbachia endosymbiont of Drosophila mauritiana]QCB63715.1 NUDIX domain-containing protein [Wolbachia endosymbiont of Drosophila mauritiana]QWE33017.1 NUDIX hydrolase [Wolbachia endosymbiont of Drosophila simulans]TGB06367.1 NUDIX domain-containing protein [Wolbachia endosymbiont of Drosophila mauritiana]
MNNNRHKVHVSVNLLLIKENSVLLSLRHNTELSGNCWGLIAGHLEPEESVTSAMIREAKEELEIDIKKSDLNFTSIIHYPHKPDYIDFFFKCCKWHNEIKNMEPNKCRELRFFNISNLPGNIVQYMKQGIECFESGIILSEIGW